MKMKKRYYLLLSLFFILLFGCNTEKQISKYPESVGDIEYNPEVDNHKFVLCNEKNIYQYFNDSNGLEYKGEKIVIDKIFHENYNNLNILGETGLIRIRFIVNCKGETDRFRVLGMDEYYGQKAFNKNITDQLLKITKGLSGWTPKKINGQEIDYYQYLIFKIVNGNLIEILP